MREEWFVTAKRNDTEVELAAPEGEGQAEIMADLLKVNGWETKTELMNVPNDDPRFHAAKK